MEFANAGLTREPAQAELLVEVRFQQIGHSAQFEGGQSATLLAPFLPQRSSWRASNIFTRAEDSVNGIFAGFSPWRIRNASLAVSFPNAAKLMRSPPTAPQSRTSSELMYVGTLAAPEIRTRASLIRNDSPEPSCASL